jgi:bifunctional non-homologous end joining protein LigD
MLAAKPCLPTSAPSPPGPEWLHEIKHDGLRMLARRDGVRGVYCRGPDWVSRFPLHPGTQLSQPRT